MSSTISRNVPAALLALDKAILELHMASMAIETRRTIGELVLNNPRAHLPVPRFYHLSSELIETAAGA